MLETNKNKKYLPFSKLNDRSKQKFVEWKQIIITISIIWLSIYLKQYD